MKDTIDRPAAVRVLASVPAWEVPVVAMATPVDPILTAIKLDRIAYIAFADSLNRTAEGKQHRRKVAKSHVPMRTLTKPQAPARNAVSGSRDDAVFGVRARRAVLPLVESPPK
jgi:hypothetical protein